MKSKFLEFDVEAVYRAAAQESIEAGWEPYLRDLPDGFTGGPAIYLCHYEAQYLFLVQLVIGGVEKVQAMSARVGITFQDACNTLGTAMDELAARIRPLDRNLRNLLAASAAQYLGGTKTYALAKEQAIDQFVVIRQFDAENGEQLLRPAACTRGGPMRPEEVSEFVLEVLRVDRQIHPRRFRKGQPLRFDPKPLT